VKRQQHKEGNIKRGEESHKYSNHINTILHVTCLKGGAEEVEEEGVRGTGLESVKQNTMQ